MFFFFFLSRPSLASLTASQAQATFFPTVLVNFFFLLSVFTVWRSLVRETRQSICSCLCFYQSWDFLRKHFLFCTLSFGKRAAVVYVDVRSLFTSTVSWVCTVLTVEHFPNLAVHLFKSTVTHTHTHTPHHWRRAFQLETFGRKYSKTFQCAVLRQMDIYFFTQ